MIYLYADVLGPAGGIETYLHALSIKLLKEKRPFRVAVSEQKPSPVVDELVRMGVDVYRQRIIPGDRWHIRKRLLIRWLKSQLHADDWVYCVRQPMPELYLKTIKAVHARGAKLAASWALAPEFLIPPETYKSDFNKAVSQTDVVISVSRCTAHQFREIYGYDGEVNVVRYHNLPVFSAPVPMPQGPPWKIGYMGRLDKKQKNLDTLVSAFSLLSKEFNSAELHFYGGGSCENDLMEQARSLEVGNKVFFHGPYDHRKDLPKIIEACHAFVYPSRFEGGPCFTLLEILQAGRFCVASAVGGIPDIYAGHKEAGLLVSPVDVSEISSALKEAIGLVSSGEIDQQAIRQRYLEEFSMESAHYSWLMALGMSH